MLVEYGTKIYNKEQNKKLKQNINKHKLVYN